LTLCLLLLYSSVVAITIESAPHIQEISLGTQAWRTVARVVTYPFFKRWFNHGPESQFSRAEDLAEDGYGTVVNTSHFGKSDMPIDISRVFASPVLGRREVLLPIAIHQFKEWYVPVGRLLGIELAPIITPDSLEYVKTHPGKEQKFMNYIKTELLKDEERDLEETISSRLIITKLLRRYIDRGIVTLGRGGAVIMATQGERCANLNPDTYTSSLSLLLGRANEVQPPLENIAVTSVGLGLRGVITGPVRSYEGRNGYNFSKIHEVNEGSTMTKREIEKRAQEPEVIERARERKLRPVDEVGYEELARIVPLAYLSQEPAA